MSEALKFKNPYRTETAELALMDWQSFIASSPAPAWLNALRNRAREDFEEQGIPGSRLERFKYANLAVKLKPFQYQYDSPVIRTAGNADHFSYLQASLDDIPGWAKDMLAAPAAGGNKYGDMMLWDLCNAYARDGYIVDVPANAQPEGMLKLHIAGKAETQSSVRGLINIADGADYTIFEYQDGDGSFWENSLSQIRIGKNARLRHYRIQARSAESAYTQNTHVVMDRDAVYEAFTLTKGAAISRNQIHAEVKGEGGNIYLAGVNLLNGSQLADTTITIEHQAPNCHSNQTYKSVLTEKSHGVFQGKVHVHQAAQKTDGYQLSNALILSPLAEMDTKPELEIYADDVKCSHGATTGRLDEEPLFYLRARGIPESQARALLIESFCGEALAQVTNESAREMITEAVAVWLKSIA